MSIQDIFQTASALFTNQNLLVKTSLSIGLFIYIFFAFVLYIQTKRLNTIVTQSDTSPILNFLSLLHLLSAIILLGAVLLIL